MKLACIEVLGMKVSFEEDNHLEVHSLDTYINREPYFRVFAPCPNIILHHTNLVMLHLASDRTEFLECDDVYEQKTIPFRDLPFGSLLCLTKKQFLLEIFHLDPFYV